jgi:3-methyladenine DNA glycosylase Tag
MPTSPETHHEHERPKRPRTSAGYLAALCRGVFSAGMNWKVIEAKWDGLKEAFLEFDPERVAAMTPKDVQRLMGDTRVVRNRPKIEATIENARTILDLSDEFGSMRKYLASLGGFEPQVRDLKKRFKFVGDMGAYQFLWLVGEDVPEWGTWKGLFSRRAQKK